MVLRSNATGKKREIGPCSRFAEGRIGLQWSDTSREIQTLIMHWSEVPKGLVDCGECGETYFEHSSVEKAAEKW
eukprot:12865513-Prorocentrum_lima.AAC.1